MVCKVYCEVSSEQDITGVPEEGYAPYFFPEEGDYLPFFFTGESFTRVLSALTNGAYITYGDAGRQVIWDFLVNVEFPVPFCDLLVDALNTCEDAQLAIAGLIEANEPIQSALRGFVTGDTVINEYFALNGLENALTPSQRDMNLFKPEECGWGFLFNETSQFVSLMDQLTIDLFEAVEVGTNILEQTSIFAGLIGSGAGTKAAASLVSIVDQLISFGKEEYEGAYDTGMYDDLRCDLFCLAKDDCNFSIDRAFDYYTLKLDAELPSNPMETLSAVLQFLLAGDYPGDASVYAMHLLVIACLRAGRDLLGIDFVELGLRLLAAGDDEDNDWEVLCEDCVGVYTYAWDFLVSDGGFTTLGANQGVYGVNGWEMEYFIVPAEHYVGVQMKKSVPIDANITGIFLGQEDVVLGAAGAGRFAFANVATGTAPALQAQVAGDNLFAFEVTQDDDEIIVVTRAGQQTGSNPGGSGFVTRVVVTGNKFPFPEFTGGEFV